MIGAEFSDQRVAITNSTKYSAWVTIPSQRGDTKANAMKHTGKESATRTIRQIDAYRNLMNPSL
jgi:hypothetical protein